jgi:copper resistance protein D
LIACTRATRFSGKNRRAARCEKQMQDFLYYARAVHFAATLMVAGIVFFVVFIGEPAFRKASSETRLAAPLRRRLAWVAWISLGLCLLSGATWLLFTAASMSGQPLSEVYAQDILWTVLLQTDFGNDWLARLTFACILAGIFVPLFPAKGTLSAWLKATAVGFAAALVGSLAWAGHAIGDVGVDGIIHPVADVLHLIAVAAWVGALVPLALLLSMPGNDADALTIARVATLRFSTLGIVSVATILVTGLVNSWYLVGSVSALSESEYGHLLSIKIVLFVTMVGIAAWNWSQLTPKLVQNADLPAAQKARRQLRRNAAIEAIIGAAIISIVAVLGILPPASHAHHEAASGPIPADASFQHIHGEDGMADVLIEPGHVGTASATIHLWNDDLETLAAKNVTLSLTAPAAGSKPVTRSALRADDTWRVDGIQLPISGNWTVTVVATLMSNERLELTAPIVIDPK